MTADHLKDLYGRQADALSRRPRLALGSGLAEIRLGEGLRCEVADADRQLVADVSPDGGGAGAGPDPGQLMRASLGASLAMGYRLWAARLEVPIDGIALDLLCEYDLRGQLGITDEVPVGWRRLVFVVTIESAAPEADVRRVVEAANRHSPMLANLSPAIEQVHRLAVARRTGDSSGR